MATLAQLNILMAVKGLPQIKSDLNDFKDGLEGVEKSAKESAKVFSDSFKESERHFKSFISELRSGGRELKQIGNEIRNFGLVVTGTFAAAFVTARKDIPEVAESLDSIKDSFKDISVELARAALPSLKEFASLIKVVSKTIKELSGNNEELVNSFLKFAAVTVVIGTVVSVLGSLSNSLGKILDLLKKVGLVAAGGGLTATGALAAEISAAVAGCVVLYNILKKISDLPLAQKIFKVAQIAINPIGQLAKEATDMGSGQGIFKKTQPLSVGFQGFAGAERLGAQQGTLGSQQKSPKELAEGLSAVGQALGQIRPQIDEIMTQAEQMAQSITISISTMFNGLAEGIGQSVGQAIVFGQNLGESLAGVLKNFAAELISMLVSVIAKIIILRGLGVVGPIPSAALFGGAAGFADSVGGSSGGKSIGGFFRNLIPFADGGLVRKPTAALIGEAGPEAVIPLDKMDQMGGGVTVNLHGHTFLNDEAQIDRLVRKIKDGVKRATSRRTGGQTISL